MTFSEELIWRGFVNQTTYKDLSNLDKDPVTFYWGVDPSSDSMTIGNLAAAMMVKAFIRAGHKPVLLVGGATGLIGDPDGKKDERDLITTEELEKNKTAITSQYKQIFGSDQNLTVVDNYDWFKDMGYLTFLRDIGKHVPTRQMLARDFVQTRLGEENAGLSYAEFSYVLIQAYDFLHLYEDFGVRLQVCGSDQWGNSIAGVDLIRRKTGGEANVYSSPLIVNPTTGIKFGKSEDGAVWLDPNKTTPTQFYQFWINVEDEAVETYLKVFTELDKETIDNVVREHQASPEKRLAQNRLAREVTRLVHGDGAVETAKKVTDVLTGRVSIGEASDVIDQIKSEIPSITSALNGSIIESLVNSKLASSNGDARRLIHAGAISINGQKVERENYSDADFINGRLLLRRGKAFKDSALVSVG